MSVSKQKCETWSSNSKKRIENRTSILLQWDSIGSTIFLEHMSEHQLLASMAFLSLCRWLLVPVASVPPCSVDHSWSCKSSYKRM